MLIQILLASILTQSFCRGITVAPPAEDSHTEASNTETTKIGYDYSPGSKVASEPAQNVQQSNENARHLNAPDASWSYQPFIEYTNVSPHSKSITQIAFGKDAVEALQKSKEPQHQSSPNILYLQSEVAKPVDNQLPVQDQQNVYYLPQGAVNHQDTYATQPPSAPGIGPGPLLYYTHVPQVPQVPQQLHPVQQNENVVYITPQPHDDYGPPAQHNYYQPNHMYLVTHIQPTGPQPQQEAVEHVAPQQNTNQLQVEDDKTQRPKNIVVDTIKYDKNEDANKDKHDEEHDKKKEEEKKNNEEVLVESNTAKAIIEEYERHYIKRRKNVDVRVDGESGTTPSPYPSATTPLSITKPAPLSRQPIIVADLDENNLEYDDKSYSTTQSTIKTVKTSSSLYHATQPLIVTQRPLGTTFLAPITAGVQLQSVDTPKLQPKDAVVVEVQKSVPYYLGKFEFVQNNDKPTKNDEIKQNVDLGANLLKYSIERLPNPQAFISEFNQSGPGTFLTQLSYSTIHHDQEQDSDQFDYKVQNAPYQQILVPAAPQLPAQVEVTKLEKVHQVEPELPQPVILQHHHQHQTAPPHQQQQIQVRQVFVPQPHIISVPVKTVADYVQKPLPHQHHIAPLVQSSQPHYNQQPVLLEPFPQVTKLIPQYVPLKHHQEVQKVPMKSYSYAPSYQPSHYHHHHNHQHNLHNIQHNYQISHSGHSGKKPKHLPPSYPHLNLGNHFFQTVKFNDYIGMKPPKSPNPNQHIPAPSASNQQPSLNGPPFKASQHLQTIHEYLPATQLTDQQVRKYRNPRHSFESSIRLEYGFMPPLIPSIEIDEFGKPIEKSEA